MTSTTMNGSSRAPKRDLVRRTPFATALILPCWRVRSVTMRSASPSFWARRTIAASRYRAMGSIVLCRTSSVGMTCRSPTADRLRTMTLDATTLDYLDHLARDSARFVEVLRQTPPGTQVSTCPDWDADDLLWHLSEVQWFWGTIVGRGLTAHAEVEAVDAGDRPGDRDGLLALFDRVSRELHHRLSTTSPDTPAWTWADEQSVGFIRRRQAHDCLLYTSDAELTAGDRTPMDADLSTDGVDEVLRVMYGGAPSWGRFTPDSTQTVRVCATDT